MAEELCITIPCKPAKPWTDADVRPIHVFLGNDSTGAARTCWQCPYCKWQFYRRKSCEKHMGMVMNTPAGCPVLKAQDEARRADRKKLD